jgi:hypothetical protein
MGSRDDKRLPVIPAPRMTRLVLARLRDVEEFASDRRLQSA